MSDPQPGRIREDRWPLVAVAGLLSFVAMLDMNIVNVALVDIADGLHVSAATAQWAVLGYQLPVVALLLPVGRWPDGVGLRPALLTATTGFALCSAFSAAAPSAGWLIAARVVQGACAAVLFVLMPVLATTGCGSVCRRTAPERAGGVTRAPKGRGEQRAQPPPHP
ncbi:MFS transporter, partial [Streptomyces sp. NPDC002814]